MTILTILFVANIAISTVSYTSNMNGTTDADLIGAWLVESIERKVVVDKSPASFRFLAGGRLAGNASCNRFTGEFVSSNGNLSFGDLAMTAMACIGPLSEQENRFAKALRHVATWKIENNALLLFDEHGVQLFRAIGFKFD